MFTRVQLCAQELFVTLVPDCIQYRSRGWMDEGICWAASGGKNCMDARLNYVSQTMNAQNTINKTINKKYDPFALVPLLKLCGLNNVVILTFENKFYHNGT